jgi:TatD DNase family protein
VGIDRAGALRALELAAVHPILRVCVGCHPHEASRWDGAFAADMRAWAVRPEVLAFGELGLDFYRNYAPPADQDRAFREQLRLAAELDMPVVFHVRAAEAEFLRVLDGEGNPRRAVVHAFSHDMTFAAECLLRGFWLGIGGVVTYKNSRLPAVLERVAPERILLETDCPWLSPVPFRGRRNEPDHLRHVLPVLAGIWGWEAAALERQIDENFRRFAGLAGLE